jgi:hypothetical protein
VLAECLATTGPIVVTGWPLEHVWSPLGYRHVMPEFVYLLTHDAMPDLTKIGRSSTSVEERVSSLNSTSVPFPFRCYYAAEVLDSKDVERRLHEAFDDHWVGKEFYKINPARAAVILEMVALRDATPKTEVEESGLDSEHAAAPDRERIFRRRFSLYGIGLKKGDVLQFARNRAITATVESDSSILYNGKELSISAAALDAIHKCGYEWKAIQGPAFWLYNGESVQEIESRLRDE